MSKTARKVGKPTKAGGGSKQGPSSAAPNASDESQDAIAGAPVEVQAAVKKLPEPARTQMLAFIQNNHYRLSANKDFEIDEILKLIDVIPDGGNRLMALTEREQQHRHETRRQEAELDALLARRGQLFGGWITAGMIATALAFAAVDKLTVALGTFVASAIVHLGAWVMNRPSKKAPKQDDSGKDAEKK